MPSSNDAQKFEPIDLSSISRISGDKILPVQQITPTDSKEFLSKFEMDDIKSVLSLDVKPEDGKSDFRLNSVVKQYLNIDVEEKIAIEEQVQEKVQEKIAEIQEQARKEAYDKGYKKGLEDSKKEVFESEAPMREKFQNLLMELSLVRKEVLESNKEFFTDIVYRVCRYILLRELKTDNDFIIRLATHLVERQECRDDVRVFLSPSDFHRSIEIDDALSKALGKLKNLSIDVDESIQPGNCRIETRNGIVESDINMQLREIATCMGLEDKNIQPVNLSEVFSEMDSRKSENINAEYVKDSEGDLEHTGNKQVQSQDSQVEETPSEAEKSIKSSDDDSEQGSEGSD